MNAHVLSHRIYRHEESGKRMYRKAAETTKHDRH